MKKNRIYDREFKENAVKLNLQRDDIKALAIELGISSKLLYINSSEYFAVQHFFALIALANANAS